MSAAGPPKDANGASSSRVAAKPHASGERTSEIAALQRARARLAAGDVDGARAACAALTTSSNASHASAAHLVLSACADRAGDPRLAERHVDAALARNPSDALAHYAKAQMAERGRDPAAAIASLEKAVQYAPDFVSAHQLLGILYGEQGDVARAAEAFARVVALDPRNARGYNNLGNALRTLGRRDEARVAFERAVALKPDYELAIANVAVAWRDAGECERAEKLVKAALTRARDKPPLRALVVTLAGLLRERGALDEAMPLYEQAIAQAPKTSGGEWFNLGRVYAERDEPARAVDAYRRAHALDPHDLRGAIGARLSLPMIYADPGDVARARQRFAEGLAELHACTDQLVHGQQPNEVLDGLRWTNFFLAYQGRDDRTLQASYADFVRRALEAVAPQWRELPKRDRAPRERLRIGFASAFFHDGTAGNYFRSWITDLARDRFEVFVYHLAPGVDGVAAEVRARADAFFEFGGSRARPSVIAPTIRDHDLDVLVYPELGMEHTTFVLAALRLAPRQIMGWGHPVTSGHATIDTFVTCDAMEPAGAERHYTEALARLPGIGTSYRRPRVPDAAPRARFGLPDDRVLFLCPQSLFKVHPDNDSLLAVVLAANPRASLVTFDGRHPRVTARFRERIHRVFDAHGVAPQRLIVLPAQPHDDYLRINRACDAMLDTLHWSGGNTSLDALACGLPVVTLPGALMRGRQSAAMLRAIDAPELVARDADDYVAIATRIADDAAWRAMLRAKIGEGLPSLFDDQAPVRALAEVLASR